MEDVTEEERDEPPWRWPLKQNNMIMKQTEKKKTNRGRKWRDRRGMNKIKEKKRMRGERKRK